MTKRRGSQNGTHIPHTTAHESSVIMKYIMRCNLSKQSLIRKYDIFCMEESNKSTQLSNHFYIYQGPHDTSDVS